MDEIKIEKYINDEISLLEIISYNFNMIILLCSIPINEKNK